MGLAVIIPTISFANNNIGSVTLLEYVALESLSINGPSKVAGTTDAASFTVSYYPIETSQRGVSWSITSGGTYATVDADTGIITILSAASTESSVTIRATSLVNTSIYVEKTISVLYHISLESRTNYIQFTSSVRGSYITDDVTVPTGGKLLVAFNSDSFYPKDICGMEGGIRVSMWKPSDHFVMIGQIDGYYFQLDNPAATGTKYLATLSASDLVFSPDLGAATKTAAGTYSGNGPIAVGGSRRSSSAYVNLFTGKIYGVEIYDADNTLLHCLLPQSDLTLLDLITGNSYTLTGDGTYGTD